ncbi:hypothetical protein [Silvibacterium acidisoli]|uniref:hypothetical protein n=1 Tax=Acidobacteriaceae bacterium ZG23-2 TaxID=2883246 RepID=UPI00406C9D1D
MSLRSFQPALLVCLAAGTLWAAADPMAGVWKLNPAKSKLTDQMKVDSAGPNRYTFHLSATNPETIVADGTDQPGIFGTTLAVTVLGPDQWKVVRKKDGKMLISAIWDLSSNGRTLTDHFTGYRADGSTSNLVYTYTRAAGGSGFAGTWESAAEEVNSTYEIRISSYETNGLSFVNPAQKMTMNVQFDGKDYAVEGPSLPAGYTTSGRRLGDGAVELTDKIDGKVLDTRRVEVAPGGETLTMTTHIPGRDKPNIEVFDRR